MSLTMIDQLEYEWASAKAHRPTIRGFLPITMDFLRRVDNINSMLEFGIAGGGAHEKWHKAGTPIIGGIEIWDPEDENKDSSWQFWKEGWDFLNRETLPKDDRDAYKFIHACDSYADDTPEKFFNKHQIEQWDVIIDDGKNGCGGQEKLIPLWKDWLNPDGVMITFTPNGYGCDEQRKQSWSDNINAFEVHASHGMMIFDCTPWVDWEHEGYPSIAQGRWMGVYTPNMDKYRDIYLKYEPHIVAGGAFLE